jgi:hypothetical protein
LGQVPLLFGLKLETILLTLFETTLYFSANQFVVNNQQGVAARWPTI